MATTAEQEFFKGTLLCLKMLCCLTKVFPEKYTCFNKKPLVKAGKKIQKGPEMIPEWLISPVARTAGWSCILEVQIFALVDSKT